MIIAFWGPTPFAGRKSTNLLLMAYLSSVSGGEQLLIHADERGSGPEHFLLSGKDRSRMMSTSEFGLELLDRMLRCERYDKSLVVNSSYTFAGGRMHVLPVGEAEYFRKEESHAIEILTAIAKRSRREFGQVWIEVPAGENAVAEAVCAMADVVVINLAQSPLELGWLKQHREEAREVYLIGAYERKGVLTGHNIMQLYPKLKGRCAVIPYQRELLQSCFLGRTGEYAQELLEKRELEGGGAFVRSLDEAHACIMRIGEERDAFLQ